MRAHRNAVLCIAAVAALMLTPLDGAFAQKNFSRGGAPNIGDAGPRGPVRGGGGFQGGGGYRGGGGWGVVVPAC